MSFRIFIADDEPLIRADLKELLEEIGHKVIGETGDGLDALRLIEKIKPDVVILDIKMPGLDGITIASKITHLCPVIILTAYSERQLIQRARNAGVMAYLTKPFRQSDIAPAIELAVSNFLEKSTLADRVAELKEQLEVRKLVEKAKGLLMLKENLTEIRAYRRLQKLSMDKNKSMKEVAEAIILMLG